MLWNLFSFRLYDLFRLLSTLKIVYYYTNSIIITLLVFVQKEEKI